MKPSLAPLLLGLALTLACEDDSTTAPALGLTDAPEPRGKLVWQVHGHYWDQENLYLDGDEFMWFFITTKPEVIYRWGSGRLNAIGKQRFADALAQVDPTMTDVGACRRHDLFRGPCVRSPTEPEPTRKPIRNRRHRSRSRIELTVGVAPKSAPTLRGISGDAECGAPIEWSFNNRVLCCCEVQP